jgi:hypothetical protein
MLKENSTKLKWMVHIVQQYFNYCKTVKSSQRLAWQTKMVVERNFRFQRTRVARFLKVQNTNAGKIYQIIIKIYQMAVR